MVAQYGIQYGPDQPFDGKHGMSKRSVFVIAADGTVRYRWVTEDPLVPPIVDHVLECLRDIQQRDQAPSAP